MFEFFKKKPPPKAPKRFPPIPDWQPAIKPNLQQLIERAQYYTDAKRDFAVFTHGTIAILPLGLSHEVACKHALDALHAVFRAHLDMNPRSMDDGNILIGYNHDIATIVLNDFVLAHWAEIDANHQRAIATDEVLITPEGPNVFDDFGKKALFGRCFMFMDALSPAVVNVVRARAS
jgi:hypothetical protein